jgi:hypothetical protein
VLATLKRLDVQMPECNDLIRTDVTEMDLQCSQPPCFVPSVPDLVKHKCPPLKKARLKKKEIVFNLTEKVVKRVSFDKPILTKNELEPNSPLGNTVEVPVELKQTKEFDSLPIIGKAQRSIYSYMLTMKMEQQLEKV